MRSITLIALAVLCALLFSACGDSPSSSAADSLDGSVGYWLTPEDKVDFPEVALLHIEKRGDTYYLGIDGREPQPATLADGRIVLPWEVGGKPVEFGMDGERPAIFAWVSERKYPRPGQPEGFYWSPLFSVERLSTAEGEEIAALDVDRAMLLRLSALNFYLRSWAKEHGGQPPAAEEVRSDSAFGRWVVAKTDGWLTDPYTGEALRAGTGPGQFTYTVEGKGYTLTGHRYDGTPFTLEDAPRLWPDEDYVVPDRDPDQPWEEVTRATVSGERSVKLDLGTHDLGEQVRLGWVLSGSGNPPVTLEFEILKTGVPEGLKQGHAITVGPTGDSPLLDDEDMTFWDVEPGEYRIFFSQSFPRGKGPGYDIDLTVYTRR